MDSDMFIEERNALIVEQLIEIRDCKRDIEEMQTQLDNIYAILYGIGGPLNDNKLKFSKEQLKVFHEIGKCTQEAFE
jgi:hypothetical protein